MSKTHGRTRADLEASGAVPKVVDTERSRGEDACWDRSTRRLGRPLTRRGRRET